MEEEKYGNLLLEVKLNESVILKTLEGDIHIKKVTTKHGTRWLFIAPKSIEIRRMKKNIWHKQLLNVMVVMQQPKCSFMTTMGWGLNDDISKQTNKTGLVIPF